jgi:uncharacterized protein YndB with AHSA1/START domain
VDRAVRAFARHPLSPPARVPGDHRPRRLLLTTQETYPDGSTFVTELEFTFEAQGAKTLMTMAQRGFPTTELRDQHRRGLPNAFDRLERVLG